VSSKRIFILTLSVGTGHVRAAEVLQRALYDCIDPVEVRLLDALKVARSWFLTLYVRPYWWLLRRAPGLWRWLFERRQKKLHRGTAPRWVFRRGCKEVLEQLKAYAPHLVIANEIGALEIAALGKREGWFHAPILAVHTDFQTEPPWVQAEVDVYCVGSDEARSQLVSWGTSPNRILVCGIPVDPVFAIPFDKSELRRALGLDGQRPVVLVMGGGMGPAPLDAIVGSLELCRFPLQVLVVAGHDRAVRQALEHLRRKVTLDLHIFGWTDTIPELMAAADLLITKPGGLTTAEALSAGLPMIVTHPIPGPEERHVRYLTQQGVAAEARTLGEIPQLVTRMLSKPENLVEISRRQRDMSRPDAAHAIAQVGQALLEKSTYIDLLATPPSRSDESRYLM
jgi:processive 1,2-diacylglycerol beta-glucosyltransferase